MIIGMDANRLAERRGQLADWLYRERAGAPYTVGQIVDVSGIYDRLQDRDGKCRSDLRRLRKNNIVEEDNGRPTRWSSAL